VIPLPTSEDAQQVFFARKAIESQTAVSAALHATEEEITSFKNIMAEHEKAFISGDKEAYSTLNERFHLGIAQAGCNTYLERYCRQIYWRSNLYIFFFDRFYLARENDPEQHLTIQQHKAVLNAIADKDPQRAGSAMIAHVEHTYRMLVMPWEREKV
jgi:DNA-binding GntR family transcriptional regulator